VRTAVITAERQTDELRNEISAMRDRVSQSHPDRPDVFDIKYSHGGMMDAEFVMQFLILSQSSRYPQLLANAGNIALLERAEALGLLPPGTGHAAASAYRTMRQVQHHARLDEAPSQVALGELAAEREAVLKLWNSVFTPALNG